MIWLIIFIISNYSLASSPPKVPGGVKRDIFSESRTLIHRAFSDRKYQNSFPKEWYLYFHSLCTICHKKLCIFLPKRKDDWYDMMGYNLGKYTGKTNLHKTCGESDKNCWELVYFWGFLTFPPPSSDLEHAQRVTYRASPKIRVDLNFS